MSIAINQKIFNQIDQKFLKIISGIFLMLTEKKMIWSVE